MSDLTWGEKIRDHLWPAMHPAQLACASTHLAGQVLSSIMRYAQAKGSPLQLLLHKTLLSAIFYKNTNINISQIGRPAIKMFWEFLEQKNLRYQKQELYLIAGKACRQNLAKLCAVVHNHHTFHATTSRWPFWLQQSANTFKRYWKRSYYSHIADANRGWWVLASWEEVLLANFQLHGEAFQEPASEMFWGRIISRGQKNDLESSFS